eukprot:2681140-Prymnesium_polylepis.1
MLAAASVPCAPRLTFVHAFRCDKGFQIRAYEEVVRTLVHNGEADDARVGFWDVDEYLLVAPGSSRHDEDETASTSVDRLFRRAQAPAPMWVLQVKPFGPSFHREAPAGFAPANFLMGADLDDGQYGAFPKSMCSLGALRASLQRGTPLFPAPPHQGALTGFWPHHCLHVSVGWTFPRADA